MKIATYNIWDSDMGMPICFRQLTDEISRIKADIICLQEESDVENIIVFQSFADMIILIGRPRQDFPF